MKSKTKILVVDDEAIMRESLHDWLTEAGYRVFAAGSARGALELIKRERPKIVIADLVMPRTNGIELMKQAKELSPDIEVIITTTSGSVPTAIAAIREGAYDYIEKPFNLERAEVLIERLVERQQLIAENNHLHRKLEERHSFDSIIAKSTRMRQVIEVVRVVAKSQTSVLITGETGTGKRLVAQAIHNQSDREDKPFVTVSCAALPESLLESELFGHERGAFTGAYAQKKGKFEVAHHGTLFLDEIGKMNANIQARLLRVLEERQLTRAGGKEPVRVDTRLISATNRDIKRAVAEGRFRQDLYYRLNMVNIELPPLRERQEDIPLLSQHFLRQLTEENGKEIHDFSPEAAAFLLSYDWPGNVREMENAIERAVVLAKGRHIVRGDLPQHSSARALPTEKDLREVEKNHILSVLAETGGNYAEAARVLGISRMTLYNKARVYGTGVVKKLVKSRE